MKIDQMIESILGGSFMSMLEDVHSRGIKKYVAAVLFGMIVLVFIFLGSNPRDNAGPGYAAQVNGQVISIREFRTSLDQMVQFYSQMFGGQFDAEAQKRMQLRGAALDQLIARTAILQVADHSGFHVSAEEVRDIVTSIPAFQQEGKFRREFYDNYLASQRLSAAQFEDDVKRSVLLGKVRETFEKGVIPSHIELDKIAKALLYKYNVEFLRLDAARLAAGMKPTSEETKQILSTPEGLKEAQDAFNANKSNYEKAEQVRARHILVSVDPTKPDSDRLALEKIKKAQELVKTRTFDAVAKEMSDDPGSKEKGGDLGFFSRGRMAKEFEDAAFSQPLGVVGEPLKTAYGYHLIKVEGKTPKVEANFETAKTEIAQNIVTRKKREQITNQMQGALTKGSLAEVNKIAGQASLKWEETGEFSEMEGPIPKIGDLEEVRSALPALTKEAPLYSKLISNGGEQYVLRLKSKTVSNAKPTTTASHEELRQKITAARVRDMFAKWNETVVKSAKIDRNTQLLEGEIE